MVCICCFLFLGKILFFNSWVCIGCGIYFCWNYGRWISFCILLNWMDCLGLCSIFFIVIVRFQCSLGQMVQAVIQCSCFGDIILCRFFIMCFLFIGVAWLFCFSLYFYFCRLGVDSFLKWCISCISLLMFEGKIRKNLFSCFFWKFQLFVGVGVSRVCCCYCFKSVVQFFSCLFIGLIKLQLLVKMSRWDCLQCCSSCFRGRLLGCWLFQQQCGLLLKKKCLVCIFCFIKCWQMCLKSCDWWFCFVCWLIRMRQLEGWVRVWKCRAGKLFCCIVVLMVVGRLMCCCLFVFWVCSWLSIIKN